KKKKKKKKKTNKKKKNEVEPRDPKMTIQFSLRPNKPVKDEKNETDNDVVNNSDENKNVKKEEKEEEEEQQKKDKDKDKEMEAALRYLSSLGKKRKLGEEKGSKDKSLSQVELLKKENEYYKQQQNNKRQKVNDDKSFLRLSVVNGVVMKVIKGKWKEQKGMVVDTRFMTVANKSCFHFGRQVKILSGNYAGQIGVLKSIDENKGVGDIEIEESKHNTKIIHINFDGFSKYNK
ncbi:hypothetical protein RFI_07793, partial [Reticulomyxa filosa]